MKIAVSSYSFQQYFRKGEMKVEDTVVKAAEMGFDGIEIVDFNLEKNPTDEYIENIKKLAEEKGIEICSYLMGGNLILETEQEREEETARICQNLDIANKLGTKLFRYDMAWTLPRFKSFDMVLEMVVPYMRKIADYGEKLGIMTMIENHGMAFQDWERIEKAYNKINHKNFSLLIDIGNFACADFDNTICVSKLANLASHVHLKDMECLDHYDNHAKDGCFETRGANYIRGVAVGYGDMKVAQCIRILKKVGYDGYLSLEYEGREECVEGIRKGFEFTKRVLSEMK